MLRIVSRLFFSIVGLTLASALTGQTAPATTKIKLSDLRKEQDVLANAYLTMGEGDVARALQRIGTNASGLARENALYAAEMVARAKRLIDFHSPRIAYAHGVFFPATKEDKQALYNHVNTVLRPRLFSLEEQLVGLGLRIGDRALQDAIDQARVGDLSGVEREMKKTGQRQRGADQGDASNPEAATGTASGPAAAESEGDVGQIDPTSRQTTGSGLQLFQTSKGVVVVHPDGSRTFYPGAKLNPDGTITLLDGTKIAGNSIRQNSDGSTTAQTTTGANVVIDAGKSTPVAGSANPPARGDVQRALASGLPPVGKLRDENGAPVDYDNDAPPFVNGERRWVRKSYDGGFGRLLKAEKKVHQKLVDVSADLWRRKETIEATRNWALDMKTLDQRAIEGGFEAILSVQDGNGQTAFSCTQWDIEDDNGVKARLAPVDGNPNARRVTFSRSGIYTVTIEGRTEWGSSFVVEYNFPVGTQR